MKILINSLMTISLFFGQFVVPQANVPNTQQEQPAVSTKTKPTAPPTSTSTPTPTATALPDATHTSENPASITETPVITPVPTDNPSSLPLPDTIQLNLKADPPVVPLDGQITIHWAIENIQDKKPQGLTLQLILPKGFEPTKQKTGDFNLESGKLTIPVSSLNGSIKVTTLNVTEDAVFSATLLDANQDLLTSASLTAPLRERFELNSANSEVSTRDGKLKIKFHEDTLKKNPEGMEIEIGTPAGDAAPSYSMSAKPFEIKAWTKKEKTELKHFDEPVKFEVNLADYGLNNVQSGDVFLYWYNPENKEWEGIASIINPETNTLTALTDHFSIFDIGPNNWEASKTPSVNAFQVANFTGAATYSLPIEVPPGPGGLQPNLSLNYNSQVVDEATNDSQASWVGMGWSLESGSIMRNTHNNTNAGDDSWYLNIDGVSTEIIRTPTGEYYAADENFMKISYTANNTWTVWDKQGNIYYFEYAISMVYQEVCPGLVTLPYKWSLTRVHNIFGQELVYSYTKETKNITYSYIPEGGSWCTRTATTPTDTASYPSTITYPDGRTRVRFTLDLEPRTDYTAGFATDQLHHSFERSRLNQVVIERDTDGNGSFETIMKFYDLTYSTTGNQVWPNIVKSAGGKLSTLVSVQEFGANGSAYLPATTFTYGDYMHLTSADNGYGGVVTFDYERWYYPQARPSYISEFEDYDSPWYTAPIGNSTFVGMTYQPTKPGGVISMSTDTNDYLQLRLFDGFSYQYISNAIDPQGILILPATANQTTAGMQNFGSAPVNVYHSKFQTLTTIYRVKTKTIFDGNGHSYPYTYSYSGTAVNDAAHSAGVAAGSAYEEPFSEFRGHASVTETAPDGTQTITSYFQDDIYRGRAYNTQVIYGSKKLTETISTYSNTALQGHYYGGKIIPRYWVKLDSSENRIYNNDGINYSASKTVNTYETTYGNLISTTEQKLNGASWTAYRVFDYYYIPTNNGTQYLVSLLAARNDWNGAKTAFMGQTLYLYDSHNLWNDAPTIGKLTAVRSLANGSGYQQESYDYDTWGNRTSVTNYSSYTPADTSPTTGAVTATTVYDPAYHVYPVSMINPLGQTSITYDYSMGVPSSETDPNGNQISAQYDAFGRITKIIRLGDTPDKPTIKIEYLENAFPMPFTTTITQQVDADNTYIITRKYDGMGRQYYMNSGGAITNTIYESPTITKQSAPYFAGETAVYTTTTFYPELGKTNVTAPDGTNTSTTANGLTTTFTDARGYATITVTDIFGRTTSITPPTGPGVTYTYDELDRLLTSTRGGATTAIKYDLAGRKIAMDDPDMGTSGTVSDNTWAWTYTYDALNNLKTQTDARGCVLNMGYDSLNRLTSKSSAGAGCGTQVSTSYTYDVGVNGKGHRTSMTSGGISSSWTYDTRGRVSSETVMGYKTSYTYNNADLPITMTYPNGSDGSQGETITYGYNSRMLLNSVTGTNTYVTATGYDSASRITSRALGNTRTQAFTYNPWNVQGGRLQKITTGTLQNLTYAYDFAGNVLGITNTIAAETNTYGYDPLDRLTSWNLNGTIESYSYESATGNLDIKAGVDLNYTDAAHKHAVTSAGTNTYTYDANGNQTTRVIGAQTYTLGYDAENRLVRVTGPALTASFEYDGDGRRVKSTVNGVLTTFVGAHYEITGTTATKYYFAGAQRVAMRAGTTLSYLLSDHLGSTSITTNSSGALVSELRYKPWGEVRYSSGTTSTKYQYTGQYSHTADFGLMYYNARWYDPTLGRFAQADSIVPPGVQGLDRYAYVMNNPLRYTDPTGHRNCEEDGYNCPGDESPKKPIFYSFDGGWNDPKYSTWNLLRQGSACTACHVTHDQPGDSGIPTNDEIDLNLVEHYRSKDSLAKKVHWAAFFYVGTNVTLVRSTVATGPYLQKPNYIQVAESTGAEYFQVSTGLSEAEILAQNEAYIINKVTDGSRIIITGPPTSPTSYLIKEVGWMTESGYISQFDMVRELVGVANYTFSGLRGILTGQQK